MYIGKNSEEFEIDDPLINDYYKYIMLKDESEDILPIIYAVSGLSIAASILVIILTILIEPLR